MYKNYVLTEKLKKRDEPIWNRSLSNYTKIIKNDEKKVKAAIRAKQLEAKRAKKSEQVKKSKAGNIKKKQTPAQKQLIKNLAAWNAFLNIYNYDPSLCPFTS